MTASFLQNRVLLRSTDPASHALADLSAVALTPDGSLWVASDETTTVERFAPLAPYVFGDQQTFAVHDFLPLWNHADEIDIEGLDYADGYLWLTGSHSWKRKKIRGKTPDKDIQRLATIRQEWNRYLLGRIPVMGATLQKACVHPERPHALLTAAALGRTEQGNELINVLRDDPHLGPFLSSPLPAKENGFDIEGLAVYKQRVFLGLRGPVLQRWAIILELLLTESTPGRLTLGTHEPSGQRYKKHFVDLDGLGVRDLCFQGRDLLILAGPTMDLQGVTRLFRFCRALDHPTDSLTEQGAGELEPLGELPCTPPGDHAEGMVLFPCAEQPPGLLVVYDTPGVARCPEPHTVFADIFRLP